MILTHIHFCFVADGVLKYVLFPEKAPLALPQVGGSVHWSVPVPSSYVSALHLEVWVTTAQ